MALSKLAIADKFCIGNKMNFCILVIKEPCYIVLTCDNHITHAVRESGKGGSFVYTKLGTRLGWRYASIHCKNKRVALNQLGVSQLQVHYQKMCIQADQLHYFPNTKPLWFLQLRK